MFRKDQLKNVKHIIVIPPKDDGYYVTREPLDQMYDPESYNPYAAVCYATRLRDEFKEPPLIIDAQAYDLEHNSIKRIIKKLNPYKVTYFLSAYSIPQDVKCVDWNYECDFFISPINVDLDELLKIYDLPITRDMFLKYSDVKYRADFSFINLNRYDYLRININDLCPFHCIFCCRSGTGNAPKPVDEIVNEIEQIVSMTGRGDIFLFGSEISLFGDNAIQLANILQNKKLNKILNLRLLDRVDLIDEDLYRELIKSGAKLVEIGVESGSQKCLDFINKGITLDDIVEAFNILNKYNSLKKKAFFIIGIPNETWNDLLSSIKLVSKINPDVISIDEFYPSLGSPSYKQLKSKGKLLEVPWHLHKHPKRRLLTFKHPLYKSQVELNRIKSIFSIAMIGAISPQMLTKKNVRYCLRSLKNEFLAFLKTFKT